MMIVSLINDAYSFAHYHYLKWRVRNLKKVEINVDNFNENIIYNFSMKKHIPFNVNVRYLHSVRLSRDLEIDNMTDNFTVYPSLSVDPKCPYFLICNRNIISFYMSKSDHAKYKLKN